MLRKVSKTGKCGYAACGKHSLLFECPHCHGLFCQKHSKPREQPLPDFRPKEAKGHLEIDKWLRSDGHFCPGFVSHIHETPLKAAAHSQNHERDSFARVPRNGRKSFAATLLRYLPLLAASIALVFILAIARAFGFI